MEIIREHIFEEVKEKNNSVGNDDTGDNLFAKYPGYKRLYECFIELAETDIQKNMIEKIMKFGKYNNFRLNSMLSNEKYSEKAEIKRRITFSEMILYDENLSFYLANNELNVFHGTKIDALQTILSKGLFSASKLYEKGIKLITGEEYTTNMIYNIKTEKREFISLTDNFDTSALYAGFPYEEQSEYFKKYYGKDLESEKDILIIICFRGIDIEQKYGESLTMVKSTCNEIGVNSSINPSDIRCIITSYDKMEYVKSLVEKYGIDVLGYNHNNKFAKRYINNKKGKFYSIFNSDVDVDEQEFERCKDMIKKTLKESKINRNKEYIPLLNKQIQDSSTMISSLSIQDNKVSTRDEDKEILQNTHTKKENANTKISLWKRIKQLFIGKKNKKQEESKQIEAPKQDISKTNDAGHIETINTQQYVAANSYLSNSENKTKEIHDTDYVPVNIDEMSKEQLEALKKQLEEEYSVDKPQGFSR